MHEDPAVLGWRSGCTLKTSSSIAYMCYHVIFGSSASKSVRINWRKLPKIGSTGVPLLWDRGVADPENKPLPMCVITSKSEVLRQRCANYYKEPKN